MAHVADVIFTSDGKYLISVSHDKTVRVWNISSGEIDRINELAEYVCEQVPKITYRKWGYEQFPMQHIYGRSFPIGIVNGK